MALTATAIGTGAAGAGVANTYTHTNEIIKEVNDQSPVFKKIMSDGAGKAWDAVHEKLEKKEPAEKPKGLVNKLKSKVKSIMEDKVRAAVEEAKKKTGMTSKAKAREAAAKLIPDKLSNVTKKRVFKGALKSSAAFGLPAGIGAYAVLRRSRQDAKNDK